MVTELEPQETTPFNPVVERLGAWSVPKTEAPLVTVWGSCGTRELRAAILATAATAEAVMAGDGAGTA